MQNHQIGKNKNGNSPSIISILRQPKSPSSQAVMGAEPAMASGWQSSQPLLARARSVRGNQFASSTSVAGNTALSAMPSRNRIT